MRSTVLEPKGSDLRLGVKLSLLIFAAALCAFSTEFSGSLKMIPCSRNRLALATARLNDASGLSVTPQLTELAKSPLERRESPIDADRQRNRKYETKIDV